MSSRHTTVFTADPVYRARMELHNRLGRVRDEAETTASAVGAFPGNETEKAMWDALSAMCQGYMLGIEQLNESARQRKLAQSVPSLAHHPVGHDLGEL